MKNTTYTGIILIFVLIFALTAGLIQAKEENVGKINLALAFSLHPSMSLFDFDRMGFFKVRPGLNEAEFSAEIAKLRTSDNYQKAQRAAEEIEARLLDLDRQRADISAQLMDSVAAQTGKTLMSQLEQLAELQDKLRIDLGDIRFEIECPDLTKPEETRKKLSEIENEVLSAVEKVAADLNLSVILNSSIPYSLNYPERYRSGTMFGQGIPGISFNLFYSFLSVPRSGVSPGHQPPSSRDLINWLELTNYPEAINLLPIRPWPIVLKGGRNIISEVMKIVYDKHGIDSEIFATVDSVLHKIESDATLIQSE